MVAQYAQQYQQTQILTSSRVQIVVLLYDAAIHSIELTRRAIDTNNFSDKARFIGRAISIVGELDSVLDYEQGGDIAKSLHRLYDYMLSELIEANAKHMSARLDGPTRCLTTLREAWKEVAAQQQAPLALAR
ncbi:MAG: Flagellar secretion chaperone FliS [Nitrospira sp.]|nr:MAG: Flagellar secretion chaperone FliS [Nitrospira sp.]